MSPIPEPPIHSSLPTSGMAAERGSKRPLPDRAHRADAHGLTAAISAADLGAADARDDGDWSTGDWVPDRPESPVRAIAGAIPGGRAGAEHLQSDAPSEPELTEPTSTANEWPVSDPPRRSDLQDPMGAERDVLLWQRWARFLGAGLMVAAALNQHGRVASAGTWAPLLELGIAYGAVTAMVAWFLRYASPETVPPRLPALIMTFDLFAAAGTVYLTAPARDYDRMLILGLVVTQVAVVYYGLSCALWAVAGTVGAYLGGSLLLPPAVAGLPESGLTVAADTATFAFAALVLLYTFGTFRSRMNGLRRFCRDVEVGDLGGTYDANAERRPDDLTLLARSVDRDAAATHRVDRHGSTDRVPQPARARDAARTRLPSCEAPRHAAGRAGRRRGPLQVDQRQFRPSVR